MKAWIAAGLFTEDEAWKCATNGNVQCLPLQQKREELIVREAAFGLSDEDKLLINTATEDELIAIEQEIKFKETDKRNLDELNNINPALADNLAGRSREVRELYHKSQSEDPSFIGDLLGDVYLLAYTEEEAFDSFLDLLERRTGVRSNAADRVIAEDRALLKEQSDAIRASYEADALLLETQGDLQGASEARRTGNRLANINETAGNLIDDSLQFLVDLASDPKQVGGDSVLGLIDGFDKFLKSERAVDDVKALRDAANTFIDDYDEADPARKGEIEGKILGTILGLGVEAAAGGTASRASRLGHANTLDAGKSTVGKAQDIVNNARDRANKRSADGAAAKRNINEDVIQLLDPNNTNGVTNGKTIVVDNKTSVGPDGNGPANDNPGGENKVPENNGSSNPDTNGNGDTSNAANDNKTSDGPASSAANAGTANPERIAAGRQFEADALESILGHVGLGKNTEIIPVTLPDGQVVRTIPDANNSLSGIIEIKDVVNIKNERQIRAQLQHAGDNKIPFNLVVSPNNGTIAPRLREAIQEHADKVGGGIFRYDPLTDILTDITR